MQIIDKLGKELRGKISQKKIRIFKELQQKMRGKVTLNPKIFNP